MSEVERDNGSDLGVRVAGAFLPTVVSAHLLSTRLPKPLAWAISILIWNLLVFWIPPKPRMSTWRWLLITCALSLLAFVLAKLAPGTL